MIRQTTGAPRSYWYEIAAILLAKAVALIAIYLLFFASPAQIPYLGDHVFPMDSVK